MLRASVLLAILLIPAFSQTAQVTGRVVDPAGAVAPGANIVITNTNTGIRRAVASNEDGYYTIPLLQPGEYSISVEKTGFKPVTRSGLQLQVNEDARVDFTLEIGGMAERIEVSASAPVLQTETHALGQVVQGQQVTELPLLGRNPYALAGLAPGVRTSTGVNDLPVDQISTASTSINGQRAQQNEYLLDGAPNTASAQNQPVIFANVDSVQEFKVETNAFSAEYGRAAGGIFNVVTKGGTNEFHFTAYEFLRNDRFNANDYFANRAGKDKAPFRFNQFGGTLGGPIIRNRAFFFVNSELVRFAQGVTYTATVPDPAALAGDFSKTGKTVYDPFTTRPNPSGAGYLRDAFPGNVIPPNRINAVAARVSKYWPAPNTNGAPNFTRTDANRIDKNTWSARVDHNLSDADRIFARVTYDDTPWVRAIPYGPGFIASPTSAAQDFTRVNTVVEGAHIFSPTLIGEVRASYARLSNFRNPLSYGFDLTQLGLPASLVQQIYPPAFPSIMITGYTVTSSVSNSVFGGSLGSTGVIAFGMDQYALQGAMTKSLAQHTLKAGGEYRIIRLNAMQTGDSSTQFSFTNAFTQGPDPARPAGNAGDALASFLLGVGAGSITPAPALAVQNVYYAGFIQDEWKLTGTFTINAGLRYDFESPRTDRFNQLTSFDYNGAPPISAAGMNLRGQLSFVGVNGNSRYQQNPDRNNFAPRLGFAWRMSPRMVIRSGAGVFYGATTGLGGAATGYGVSGFQASTSMVGSLDGVTPFNTLSDPYPNGLNTPTGSSLGGATLLGQSINSFDRGNETPYSLQWNFDVQRELPRSVLLDVGYVGTRGLHMQQDMSINTLPDQYLALGDALRAQVPNPFYGKISVGPLAQPMVARAQLLRPYPQFQDVMLVAQTLANSSYHALQVKLEKRYAKGFTVLGAYTYSKLMDLATGGFSGEPLGGGAIQDYNNLAADWSVSSIDQTHRFIANAVYELPFWRDQKGAAGHLLGGWEIGVIASVYSGSPLGVTAATNNTFSQGGNQRPDWTGVSAQIPNPSPARWFDTTQFTAAPAYHYGNAPRTFGGLRGDGARNIDLSLHKNTNLTERLRIQFRAEAFNLTNTVRFAPPNTSFGNPNFGVVSSQANQPRVLQFALKLMM